MPLQWKTAEVMLFQGLDQKADNKSTVQGKLQQADNVEFDKYGALNKRRGYSLMAISEDALGLTCEDIFHAVAVYQDELVLFGHNRIYALANKSGYMSGVHYIVQRGPVPRCNIKRHDIVQGSQAAPPIVVG